MDTPQVTPGPLESALRHLADRTVDAVLGRAHVHRQDGAPRPARPAGAYRGRPGCRAMSMWTVPPTRMLAPGRSRAAGSPPFSWPCTRHDWRRPWTVTRDADDGPA